MSIHSGDVNNVLYRAYRCLTISPIVHQTKGYISPVDVDPWLNPPLPKSWIRTWVGCSQKETIILMPRSEGPIYAADLPLPVLVISFIVCTFLSCILRRTLTYQQQHSCVWREQLVSWTSFHLLWGKYVPPEASRLACICCGYSTVAIGQYISKAQCRKSSENVQTSINL